MAEKFDLDQYCSKTYPQTLEEQIAFLRDHPFLKNARAARAERYADYLTPRYHFVNAEGYMNDPNGFCYWNGRYHLFFQQLVGRVMVWGHAVSRDLVHWTELPYAIHPDPTENEESSWSGGACTTKDCASIFYYGHGGHTGLYCQKSRDPLLLNWERTTRGPAIAGDTSEAETHRVPYAQYPAVYDGTVFFETENIMPSPQAFSAARTTPLQGRNISSPPTILPPGIMSTRFWRTMHSIPSGTTAHARTLCPSGRTRTAAFF